MCLQADHATSAGDLPRRRVGSRRMVPVALLAATLALVASGCGDADSIDSTYGVRRGTRGGKSVNGTVVLAEMFEQAGHRVRSWGRLSPILNTRDVIVWFPNDFEPPTPEQRVFLEIWLADRPGRTLIYVGRDYDATIAYWQQAQETVPPSQAREVSRRLAQARADHHSARAKMPSREDCDWFTVRRDREPRRIGTLAGQWSGAVDAAKTDIQLEGRLDFSRTDVTASFDSTDDIRVDALLTSERDVLVGRVSHNDWFTSKLIVVANGSFLLNLPLVNHEHRKLAGRLIDECGPGGKRVVFLESGRGGPRVSDDDPQAKYPTGIEPLTVPPLNVILLHLAALGILFCFSVFPIFGRPRRPESDVTSDFGKHIDALGKLLGLTGDRDYALHRVTHYQQTVRRESGGSHATGPLPQSTGPGAKPPTKKHTD